MFKKIIVNIFIFLAIISVARSDYVISSFKEAQEISSQTNQSILLIFGADNCSFCVALKQDLSNNILYKDTENHIICYIDIEKNPEYKKQYQITMIPDSRIIKDDKEISKLKGYSREKYINWLNNVK